MIFKACLRAGLNVRHFAADPHTLHADGAEFMSSGHLRDHKSQMQHTGFTLLIAVPNAPQRKILDHAITCRVKSSLQIERDSVLLSQHCQCNREEYALFASCACDSIVALFCRCLFPDDAAEKTPSVSEQ